MKKFTVLCCLCACLVPILAGLTQTPIKSKDLPEKYRRWIEEEVSYIITEMEKEVYLQLQTDSERDFYIEAFWRQRDPTVGTEMNEVKEEHYRRLNHANRRFRGTGRPGWKTDRGKVYILLGEPRDMRVFRGSDIYFPSEAWYYQGIRLPGLPAAFQILFYQKGRIGDYIIYNPAMEGPAALITSFMDDPTDYMNAYYTLQNVDPVLAEASISLIPGESTINYPSMASMQLLQNLDGSVRRSVEDKYAQKFLDYKDIIEVDYSVNYIDSDALLKIIKDDSGVAFVHFSLEPENISMGSYEDRVYSRLEFNGLVRDKEEGRTVYQFENVVPLNFSEDQFRQMRQRPFNFNDVFPLIPGDYSFSFLVKNTVSKEFTSFEANIQIPEDRDYFTMTPLLLGFNAVRPDSPEKRVKPFVVQDLQLYSQSRYSFIPQDKLYVFFQIWALPDEVSPSGTLTYTFFKEDVEVNSATHPLSKYGNSLNYLETFPLASFSPGYYQLRVVLKDGEGRELLNQKENFELTSLASLPRPWVLALTRTLEEPHQVHHILGLQKLNQEDFQGAESWLEKAYRAVPSNPDYALSFATVKYHLQSYPEALELIEPYLDRVRENYELTWLLGKTYQALSRLDEALVIYNQAVSVFGVNTDLLNSLGECYIQTGNTQEALLALEKSLEIEPGQERIQELVRSLKK
jgi:GWxTD domain-containing protein